MSDTLTSADQALIDSAVSDAISEGDQGDDMLIEKEGKKSIGDLITRKDETLTDTDTGTDIEGEGEGEEEEHSTIDISGDIDKDEEDEDEEVVESDEVEDILTESGKDDVKSDKKKLTAKQQNRKLQGLAESRLNAFNQVNDSPELALGKAAISNPELVKIIQAVNVGLVDAKSLLSGLQNPQAMNVVQGNVEPLQAPVMPTQPVDYNREDLGDPNSSSSKFDTSMTKYLQDSIVFLTNSEANRAVVNQQDMVNKKHDLERGVFKKQLMQVYDLSDLEVGQFMERFDGEGKVSTDNLIAIFRQEQSGMTADEMRAAAKANGLRDKKKRRKARGPGVTSGGDKSVGMPNKDTGLINADDLTNEELNDIKYIDM